MLTFGILSFLYCCHALIFIFYFFCKFAVSEMLIMGTCSSGINKSPYETLCEFRISTAKVVFVGEYF